MVEFREGSRSDAGCVLWVEGEVDLAVADEFLRRGLACLDRADTIDLDLQGVSFIDSSGLGVLVRLRNEATAKGKTLSLVNVSPATRRLLDITGLHDVFDIGPGHA